MSLSEISSSNKFNISRKVIASLRELRKLDNYHWAIALSKDYLVIITAIYLSVGISFWFYPLSLFMIGSTQRAFTNILHYSSHHVLAKNKFINYIGGTFLSGHLVFHLLNTYKDPHVRYHHAHLGNPEKDPDLKFHIDSGLYDFNQNDKEFFIQNILLTISGYRTLKFIHYVIKDAIKSRKNKNKVESQIENKIEKKKAGDNNESIAFLIYWIVILSVIIYFGFFMYFILLWIVPLFTVTVAIGWIIGIAEHYPLPASEKEALLLTRNTKGVWWERFLFGRHYDNYHLVHHLYPGIPHWNIQKAHIYLLNDPNYQKWDDLWGGIFIRQHPHQETMLSYASKYRKFRKYNQKGSFAKHLLSI
ncbi:fatty acid desaturase family protein [Xenorhabdus nematophila]|uniref:Fatty acid desaturase involved in xenocoumacin synthesis n=1 Tax=Xenorhabdus nematophila (strain ATCC 19061 / DSM 3370 / CCUG 14189 / LMG 1036 / NCIMB 9965 / AN6) TaxID=406817 RepID=D3VCA5_XENNA|nr:fatty acid desaturase family protein [Xenorhabdus nematophila]CEE92507.1 Fatty acid desaturase involved in xenocoumacin synthesis [Xenorhabdus nematophila str. Anatoliense]CBJ89758.1 Fatty acid desaturase involved in xenocoumacin synthesis [Xenorhabdus nematophila ATCC 19061]CCW30960.1 Fatty acid desaturase involved in xenocoumacin synthesis [Xenorhabdus nematophila F1]CEE95812.1 Fatty acid desaturase involved in xenocoumacin synthesis [Xenorhabdus nematophila str. Anatoliense]CEK22642.1 Fa